MSARGVWIVLNDACSWRVRMLMACSVMMHWCALLGMAVNVDRAPRWRWNLVSIVFCVLHWGAIVAIVGTGSITSGAGSILGVLLHVVRQWSRDIVFNAHFAIVFCISMMGGEFVMWGTVKMGDSSITLCSALHILHWRTLFTLCLSEIGGGCKSVSVLVARCLSKHLPLGVPLAWAMYLVSLSVNVWKNVGVVSYTTTSNVWEVIRSTQRYSTLLFLVCSNFCIGSDL